MTRRDRLFLQLAFINIYNYNRYNQDIEESL